MKLDREGCAICGSTWGNLWAEVDGQKLFFCCALCVVQFRGLVARIHERTGWDRIDSLSLQGDRRGRSCTATREGSTFRCRVAFNSIGEIREFRTDVAPSG